VQEENKVPQKSTASPQVLFLPVAFSAQSESTGSFDFQGLGLQPETSLAAKSLTFIGSIA
jgi:hypothetical protein